MRERERERERIFGVDRGTRRGRVCAWIERECVYKYIYVCMYDYIYIYMSVFVLLI